MKRALILLSILLVSCGAPSKAVRIPPEEIPFPIKRSVEPPRPGRITKAYVVNFVRRGRLVSVQRDLNIRVTAAEAVTRSLLEGPTDGELERGILTHIPADTRLLTIRIRDSVAEVDLTGEFQSPGPSAVILLRVAQVVRTIAALPEVKAVRFSVNGEAISVPTDDGPVFRPVTVVDYASVIRRRP